MEIASEVLRFHKLLIGTDASHVIGKDVRSLFFKESRLPYPFFAVCVVEDNLLRFYTVPLELSSWRSNVLDAGQVNLAIRRDIVRTNLWNSPVFLTRSLSEAWLSIKNNI